MPIAVSFCAVAVLGFFLDKGSIGFCDAALTAFDASANFPLIAIPFIVMLFGFLMIVTQVPFVPPGLKALVFRQAPSDGAPSSIVPHPSA